MRVYCPNEVKRVIFGTLFYDPRIGRIQMSKIIRLIREYIRYLFDSSKLSIEWLLRIPLPPQNVQQTFVLRAKKLERPSYTVVEFFCWRAGGLPQFFSYVQQSFYPAFSPFSQHTAFVSFCHSFFIILEDFDILSQCLAHFLSI
jgi:hypothetical protein